MQNSCMKIGLVTILYGFIFSDQVSLKQFSVAWDRLLQSLGKLRFMRRKYDCNILFSSFSDVWKIEIVKATIYTMKYCYVFR